ncbi:MAG TPA: hypothetical protein VJZ16_02115 [Syntrophales bacterium]|nr:hypothetical protein [Syntrophales bacterium]
MERIGMQFKGEKKTHLTYPGYPDAHYCINKIYNKEMIMELSDPSTMESLLYYEA